jgi:hypothetical protein
MSEALDLLRQFYTEVVREFGPYRQWKYVTVPDETPNTAFHKWCEDYGRANGIPAKTVHAQLKAIPFIIPTSPEPGSDELYHYIAALEAGFIEESDLAKLIRRGPIDPGYAADPRTGPRRQTSA